MRRDGLFLLIGWFYLVIFSVLRGILGSEFLFDPLMVMVIYGVWKGYSPEAILLLVLAGDFLGGGALGIQTLSKTSMALILQGLLSLTRLSFLWVFPMVLAFSYLGFLFQELLGRLASFWFFRFPSFKLALFTALSSLLIFPLNDYIFEKLRPLYVKRLP
jgi:hypothetical protein